MGWRNRLVQLVRCGPSWNKLIFGAGNKDTHLRFEDSHWLIDMSARLAIMHTKIGSLLLLNKFNRLHPFCIYDVSGKLQTSP